MVLVIWQKRILMNGPLSANDPYDREVHSKILPCSRLIDVGPGIRPFDGFKAETHLCIEPHWEYAQILKDKNYPVINITARGILRWLHGFETVLFIDVIEHMSKKDGEECIKYAKKIATKQVVVFTPLGFMKQETGEDGLDAWGMHGGHWQEHKSGWSPDEFEGWNILVGKNYHGTHSAFAAIWNVK
jgi:hypothetical protein